MKSYTNQVYTHKTLWIGYDPSGSESFTIDYKGNTEFKFFITSILKETGYYENGDYSNLTYGVLDVDKYSSHRLYYFRHKYCKITLVPINIEFIFIRIPTAYDYIASHYFLFDEPNIDFENFQPTVMDITLDFYN